MPPRTVKRGSASAGAKRGGRTTRGTPKKQDQPAEREVAEETAKVEEVSVVEVETKELREEVAVQEKSPVVEDKPVIQNKPVVVEEKQPIAVDVGEVESSHEVRSDSKQSVPPKSKYCPLNSGTSRLGLVIVGVLILYVRCELNMFFWEFHCLKLPSYPYLIV